jgi:hypothetical protein
VDWALRHDSVMRDSPALFGFLEDVVVGFANPNGSPVAFPLLNRNRYACLRRHSSNGHGERQRGAWG